MTKKFEFENSKCPKKCQNWGNLKFSKWFDFKIDFASQIFFSGNKLSKVIVVYPPDETRTVKS